MDTGEKTYRKIFWIVFAIIFIIIIIIIGQLLYRRKGSLSPYADSIPTATTFFEDFESGTQNWDLGGGWHLETIDNNTVLRGSGHGRARLKIELKDNYTFRAKFKMIWGGISFNYRSSDRLDGPYQYGVSVDYSWLYLNKLAGSESSVLTYMVSMVSEISENRWREIEIRGYGNIINVYFDNELYLVYKDEKPIMTGGIALDIWENSDFLIDDVVIEETSVENITAEPRPEQLYERPYPFIPDVTHSGDLVIDGTETMVIENESYLQQGNIYINGEAKLILRNSQLAIGGNLPLYNSHIYIWVDENALLQIENSLIFPEPVREGGKGLVVVQAKGNGKVNITNSPTSIHIVQVSEGAQVTITNSKVVSHIGGLILVGGGDTKIVNSTIGSVGIHIPAGSQIETSGLKSGVYLENWDIHRDLSASNIPYNLTLENTYILKDTIRPGGYERGWSLHIDSLATAKISNSELRKVSIFLHYDENINLENLKGEIPFNFKYKEIELNNVIVRGQWAIDIDAHNIRNVTIRNSDILFIEPKGQVNLYLINSDVVELGPGGFFNGTIIFENSVWREGVGGFDAMGNNFTIKGSLRISPELRGGMPWGDAQVTREFEVSVLDEGGKPIEGAVIEVDTETDITDNLGGAKFSLVFNGTNYREFRELAVVKGGETVATREVDFFTSTPIVITLNDGGTNNDGTRVVINRETAKTIDSCTFSWES